MKVLIMKKLLILSCILLFLPAIVAVKAYPQRSSNAESEKTIVLTIGTIHDQHATNPYYSYADIFRILQTFHPDAICVEIPLSHFRIRSYLKEMTLGSIYGIKRGLKVYPIDWWTETNPRAEAIKYMQTEEYKRKEKTLYALFHADSIMQKFETKYGSLEQIVKKNTMGYEFFNGAEYNEYVERMYNGFITIFGDGCMNMYSEQRNTKMMELINNAIAENQGKRIIILTGAEHKYYFDKVLCSRKDIDLLQLKNILPLVPPANMDKELVKYLQTGISKDYYLDYNQMYWDILTPILHGPDMDDMPSIIKKESLEKAHSIMTEWKNETKESPLLLFNMAWLSFLEGKYSDAIITVHKMTKLFDEIPSDLQSFIIPFYWRNIGFCYDLKGERKKALHAYNKGIEYCKKQGIPDNDIKDIYKDYRNVPYQQ